MVVPKSTNTENSSSKTHKLSFVAQIILRVLAIATTIVASWLIITSKQTVVVYGITADASYKYSSAFKFFACANLIACGFSVLSLLIAAFIIGNNKRCNQSKYFYLFIHDLLLTVLLMAGCGAATAIGYLAKYGNDHVGWQLICDNFVKFCNRVILSLAFSYIGVLIYLVLAIVSANGSRLFQAYEPSLLTNNQ